MTWYCDSTFYYKRKTCIRHTEYLYVCRYEHEYQKNNNNRRKNSHAMSCHLSPVSNANSHSHSRRPSPAKSPTMHRRLVHKGRTKNPILILQNPFLFKTYQRKGVLSFAILALHSSTRSLQLSWFSLPLKGTDIQQTTNGHWTYRLNGPREQFSENELNINLNIPNSVFLLTKLVE